jgi:hypothetical protein
MLCSLLSVLYLLVSAICSLSFVRPSTPFYTGSGALEACIAKIPTCKVNREREREQSRGQRAESREQRAENRE